jgi:TRAP-type mannitol/chloroaromatic compound transport system permease large subunit
MKLVNALNAINSQVWAFLMLASGIFAVWLFHKYGIEIGIAAGIIGAGTNMFNQIFKTTPPPPNPPPPASVA